MAARDVIGVLDSTRIEVALGERSARAGLQVAFEAAGRFLVSALDSDDETPGAIVHGVAACRYVVERNSTTDVGRQAGVVAIRMRLASDDVHEALFSRHACR